MSRVALVGFGAGLVLLLAAWQICTAVVTAQDSVRLDTALDTRLAEVHQVEGTGSGVLEPLKLTLKNLSGRKMMFEVPPGLRLVPASSGYADLIVARNASTALGKDETRVFTLVAYSNDPGLLFSAEELDYSVGALVDEPLLAVLNFAAREDTLMPGQIALWMALTGLKVSDVEQQVGFRFSPEQVAAADAILAQAKPPERFGPEVALTQTEPAAGDTLLKPVVVGEETSTPAKADRSTLPAVALLLGLLIVAVSAGAAAAWWLRRRTRYTGAASDTDAIHLDSGSEAGHE